MSFRFCLGLELVGRLCRGIPRLFNEGRLCACMRRVLHHGMCVDGSVNAGCRVAET